MLRAILIDDEREALDALRYDLECHCPEVAIVETCGNGKDGVKAINRHKPDIVFLDIDMPFVSGFDVIEMVVDVEFDVIFTTAYDQYAVQAFRISAIDYLLKPIVPKHLISAVNKVRVLREKGFSRRRVDFLLEQIRNVENNSVHRIAIPTFEGLDFVELKDIIYCKSDGAYSHLYMTNGEQLMVSKTLRYLEEALCDFQFMRVHNSYIVNMDHVRKFIKSDGGLLVMSNGATAKVSRSRKNELLSMF